VLGQVKPSIYGGGNVGKHRSPFFNKRQPLSKTLSRLQKLSSSLYNIAPLLDGNPVKGLRK